MLISTELLQVELNELRQRYQKLINEVNVVSGAIQFCEHLLKTAYEPLPEVLQSSIQIEGPDSHLS